jgi:hypothetical protein
MCELVNINNFGRITLVGNGFSYYPSRLAYGYSITLLKNLGYI